MSGRGGRSSPPGRGRSTRRSGRRGGGSPTPRTRWRRAPRGGSSETDYTVRFHCHPMYCRSSILFVLDPRVGHTPVIYVLCHSWWRRKATKGCVCVQDGSCRVTIRPGFPGHVLFFGLCPGVRAGFRKSAVCPGFFCPIRKYIRTLPIAKAYDCMRQRKLVSFQYKMSVTSQNAILVQASCTCLLIKNKPNCA